MMIEGLTEQHGIHPVLGGSLDIINFHTPGCKDPSANVSSTMRSSKKPYLRYANLTITFRELPTHSAVCFIREAGESSA